MANMVRVIQCSVLAINTLSIFFAQLVFSQTPEHVKFVTAYVGSQLQLHSDFVLHRNPLHLIQLIGHGNPLESGKACIYCCCNSDDKGAEHSQLIRKRYFFPLRQERLFLSIVGFLGITVSIGYLFFLLLFNSGENKAFMIEIALIPYFAGPCVSTRAFSRT